MTEQGNIGCDNSYPGQKKGRARSSALFSDLPGEAAYKLSISRLVIDRRCIDVAEAGREITG